MKDMIFNIQFFGGSGASSGINKGGGANSGVSRGNKITTEANNAIKEAMKS